jgi:hypothetical protein
MIKTGNEVAILLRLLIANFVVKERTRKDSRTSGGKARITNPRYLVK